MSTLYGLVFDGVGDKLIYNEPTSNNPPSSLLVEFKFDEFNSIHTLWDGITSDRGRLEILSATQVRVRFEQTGSVTVAVPEMVAGESYVFLYENDATQDSATLKLNGDVIHSETADTGFNIRNVGAKRDFTDQSRGILVRMERLVSSSGGAPTYSIYENNTGTGMVFPSDTGELDDFALQGTGWPADESQWVVTQAATSITPTNPPQGGEVFQFSGSNYSAQPTGPMTFTQGTRTISRAVTISNWNTEDGSFTGVTNTALPGVPAAGASDTPALLYGEPVTISLPDPGA